MERATSRVPRKRRMPFRGTPRDVARATTPISRSSRPLCGLRCSARRGSRRVCPERSRRGPPVAPKVAPQAGGLGVSPRLPFRAGGWDGKHCETKNRNMPPRGAERLQAPLGTKVVPLTRNRYSFSGKGLDISSFSVIIGPLATLTEGVRCCIRYLTRHPAGRCPPGTATRLLAFSEGGCPNEQAYRRKQRDPGSGNCRGRVPAMRAVQAHTVAFCIVRPAPAQRNAASVRS